MFVFPGAAAALHVTQTDIASPHGYTRAAFSLASAEDGGLRRPGDSDASHQVQNALLRAPAPQLPVAPQAPPLLDTQSSELAHPPPSAMAQSLAYRLSYPADETLMTGDPATRVDAPFEQSHFRESRSVGSRQTVEQPLSMRASGFADDNLSEQHVITKRSSYTAPYFVGKRSLDDRGDFFRENETHEETEDDDDGEQVMEGGDEAEDAEDKRGRPMFVGRRAAPLFVGKRPWSVALEDKRGAPLFVGKRKAPLFIGKRRQLLFVGKRRSPLFVGKRRTPMFVGKRRTPMFVGKRGSPLFVGRRRTPLFVGKRGRPMFVGKRRTPMFVGKREAPMFVGKKARPMFVGKRENPMLQRNPEVSDIAGHDPTSFVGKSEEATAENNEFSAPVLDDESGDPFAEEQEEEEEEDNGELDKRYSVPLLVGKRQEEDIGQLLATLQTLQAARNYRRMIQADKRYNAPFFIGRRDSQTSSQPVEGSGVEKDSALMR